MAETGTLNEELKLLIFKNIREVSAIEGNIAGAAGDREIKTILITSCSPQEGKTVSAVSIALGLSTQANSRVLLSDGNLSSPRIHELFQTNAGPGLSDLLGEKIKPHDALRKTDINNLAILTSGSETPQKIESYDTETFHKVLDSFAKDFDYVLVDGQSVSGSSDVSVISRYFDGIIFVVECEKTRWEVLQQSIEKIRSTGGKILGVVLNKRVYYIPEKLYGKI